MGLRHAASQPAAESKFARLQAAVRHPRVRVVIHGVRVVDGAQMARGIVLLDDVEEAVEVLRGLGPHQVPLVGQRPPDVAIRRHARDDIAQVAIIRFGRHGRVSPAIVGMEEDEVGFDTDGAQVGDALLDVREVMQDSAA